MIYTRREPLGLFASIVPFNFPLEQFSQKTAAALVSGNAIIAKPASDTPMGAIKLVELMLEAGVPSSVAQVVTGRGSMVGSYLTNSPLIDAVSLTGSTEVGLQIAKAAANGLKRVNLELGGNDAFVVFDDADLELAVSEAISGRMFNNGQTCCCSKRFIIQKGIKEKFVARLIEKLRKVKIGAPKEPGTQLGPLVSVHAAQEVERQVQCCLDQGAKAVYDFVREKETYVHPCVLDHVTPEMDVAKNMEIFGPVFPIITFETEDEAVAIANGSQYGLMGAVLSSDIGKAIRVANRLESGGVVVNGTGCKRPDSIPFGGYKMSGIGREGFSHTLTQVTQEKTIMLFEAFKA